MWPITGTDQPESVIFFLSNFWNICYPGTSLEDFQTTVIQNLSYIQSNFSVVAWDALRPLTNPFSCHGYAYKPFQYFRPRCSEATYKPIFMPRVRLQAILVLSLKMLWGHLQTGFHAKGTITYLIQNFAVHAIFVLSLEMLLLSPLWFICSKISPHPKFCQTCHFCVLSLEILVLSPLCFICSEISPLGLGSHLGGGDRQQGLRSRAALDAAAGCHETHSRTKRWMPLRHNEICFRKYKIWQNAGQHQVWHTTEGRTRLML